MIRLQQSVGAKGAANVICLEEWETRKDEKVGRLTHNAGAYRRKRYRSFLGYSKDWLFPAVIT